MTTENIERVHASSTQTLLHVYATYLHMVDVFGPDDPRLIDMDKCWHGWEVATDHGPVVDVYDWGRHYAEDVSVDAPAAPVDAVVCWHVNATGVGHEAAAFDVAHRICRGRAA